MNEPRSVWLTLLVILTLGAMVAGSASATEPAGLLFLSGQGPPVTETGASGSTSLKGLTESIDCGASATSGTSGVAGETHVSLGTATITFTGCKRQKISCSSENTKGEKDAKEAILASVDTHRVSLETAGKLVPGLLLILLSDLIINCGGFKTLVLGVAIGEVTGKELGTQEVTEATVTLPAKGLSCDSNDKLCKEIIEKFGVKGCPLAAVFKVEEECAELFATGTSKFSPMALIDF